MMKKSKAITSNSNTTELKTTPTGKKFPIVLEEYLDMYLLQKKPVTDTFLEMLASTYIKWVKEETKCLLFTEFLQYQGIRREDFYRWLLRSEKLRQAHDFVIMVLCNRREVGAITRKYDSSMITKMHGFYSDIWVTETTRIAALTSNNDTAKQNITVIIPPFGEQSE